MNSNITQNLLLEPVNQEMSGQIVEGLLFFSQLQATLIPTEQTLRYRYMEFYTRIQSTTACNPLTIRA